MVTVKDEGILLEKTDLPFEKKGVYNPACIEVNGVTHLFYRAFSQDNVSSIGYCTLHGNKIIQRSSRPVLVPEHPYEKQGVEDPRITFLDGTYYLFYTAFDGKNARIAYASSKDLVTFVKKGLISPNITYNEVSEVLLPSDLKEKYFMHKLYLEKQIKGVEFLWEKDASLFPKKINNEFALIHRLRPDVQLIYFRDFSDLTDEYWSRYLKNLKEYIVLEPKYWFENQYLGGGCPPIETEAGWLFIYHSVEKNENGITYHAGAALLDKDNPVKVLGRLKDPLFSPKETWEQTGNVNRVVFPSGAVVRNGRVYIYYGAADTLVAVKSVNLAELILELKHNS